MSHAYTCSRYETASWSRATKSYRCFRILPCITLPCKSLTSLTVSGEMHAMVRTNQVQLLFSLATANPLTNKSRWFASLYEGRMLPAALAQGRQLKSRSLPLLSLATDVSVVRECCWFLEGMKACLTQQIKQRIRNR